MWRSDDLLNWTFHKMLIGRRDVPERAWYRDRFWAPEIHQKNGKFYLTRISQMRSTIPCA